MKNYISITLYFMISMMSASSIKEIIIIGNQITTDNFILQTIHHSIGDTVNVDLANQDMLNLYETGLFDDVTIYSPTDTLYSILVSEKQYIIMKPLFDKDDIIGVSLGGSLLFDNIKGENKKFELSMLLGEHSLYSLTYMNPKLQKTQDTLTVDIYNRQFENIENEYIVDKESLRSLFTIPLKITYAMQIAVAYEYNQLNTLIDNNTENNHSLAINMFYQKKFLLHSSNYKNTLNIHYRGTLFDKYYQNNNMIKLINKYYIPLSNKSGNGRLLIQNKVQINLNPTIPIYDKIYIGTENYVRGYNPDPRKNNIAIQNKLKWNNIIVSTLQWETLLVKKSYFYIDFLLFMDFGIGSNDYKKFKQTNKIRSHGMGIRFDIMKFVNLDLCLGINPYGEKEFHVIVNTKKF